MQLEGILVSVMVYGLAKGVYKAQPPYYWTLWHFCDVAEMLHIKLVKNPQDLFGHDQEWGMGERKPRRLLSLNKLAKWTF